MFQGSIGTSLGSFQVNRLVVKQLVALPWERGASRCGHDASGDHLNQTRQLKTSAVQEHSCEHHIQTLEMFGFLFYYVLLVLGFDCQKNTVVLHRHKPYYRTQWDSYGNPPATTHALQRIINLLPYFPAMLDDPEGPIQWPSNHHWITIKSPCLNHQCSPESGTKVQKPSARKRPVACPVPMADGP